MFLTVETRRVRDMCVSCFMYSPIMAETLFKGKGETKMKKIVIMALIVSLMLGMFAVPGFAQSNEVTVTINGNLQTFDVPAQIINGHTMVPVRAIGEAFGFENGWMKRKLNRTK